MAMTFSATRLKKSIFPYVTFLAEMKVRDADIRQLSQSISILEYALKKNVVPRVMEMTKSSTFNESRNMFSKMISEAATANITDEEVRELSKMCKRRSMHINILSTKVEELQDQFTKKFHQTIPLTPWRSPYKDIHLAYEETVAREMDEYNKMYESLITDLPGLNISNASDASIDFVMKRFFKLDEATIRRVLDEWVAFKRDLHLAMEKFDFTLYLLDNKSDLIFKGDSEGLTNAVRSDEEMLAKNHREEAVSELLQKWKYYKLKDASKEKVKSFKERIQQEKEQHYEERMRDWDCEPFRYDFFRSSDSIDPDTLELLNELLNEEASPSAIPEGQELLDDNASPSATPEGLLLLLEP